MPSTRSHLWSAPPGGIVPAAIKFERLAAAPAEARQRVTCMRSLRVIAMAAGIRVESPSFRAKDHSAQWSRRAGSRFIGAIRLSHGKESFPPRPGFRRFARHRLPMEGWSEKSVSTRRYWARASLVWPSLRDSIRPDGTGRWLPSAGSRPKRRLLPGRHADQARERLRLASSSTSARRKVSSTDRPARETKGREAELVVKPPSRGTGVGTRFVHPADCSVSGRRSEPPGRAGCGKKTTDFAAQPQSEAHQMDGDPVRRRSFANLRRDH